MRYFLAALIIAALAAPSYAQDELAFLGKRRGAASGAAAVMVQSFTISPTSIASLSDTTAASTTISTATVTMSNGSTFAGTIVSDSPQYYKVVGLNIQTSRAISSQDDGDHPGTFTALNRACTPQQVLSPTATVLTAQGHTFAFNSTAHTDTTPNQYTVVIDGTASSHFGAAMQVTGGTLYMASYPANNGQWYFWNGSDIVTTGSTASPGPPDC